MVEKNRVKNGVGLVVVEEGGGGACKPGGGLEKLFARNGFSKFKRKKVTKWVRTIENQHKPDLSAWFFKARLTVMVPRSKNIKNGPTKLKNQLRIGRDKKKSMLKKKKCHVLGRESSKININ